MTLYQQNLSRDRTHPVPVFQGASRSASHAAWARTTAIAVSVAAHLLLLTRGIETSTPRFALTSAGQGAAASHVEVRLVARAAPVARAKPAPVDKPVPVAPRRVDTPRPRILAASAPATRTVVVDEAAPDTVSAPQAVAALPVQAVTAPAQAATSGADATLTLPAASSVKEVRNVACDIPQPRYPFALRRAGVEGTVWVHATIGANGAVQDAEVVRTSGSGDLDASARDAILSGRCDPYIEDGHAISVAARLPVNFRLK